ncbi:sensor domain-containing diguanylate cyclase [Marinomonas sp.]
MTVKHCFFSLLIVLLSFISLQAYSTNLPAYEVSSAPFKLEHFEIEFYIDATEKMDFETVQQQTFTPARNNLALGLKAPVTWIRIPLSNTSSKLKTVYLHFPYAFHNNELTLFSVTDGQAPKQKSIDFSKQGDQPWMYRGNAVFDIEIPANEHVTVYLKSVAYVSQWFSLQLYDDEQSKRALTGLYTDVSIIIGMLLALTIYNLFLFLSSRLFEHLYYACYLITAGVWIGMTYGFFADVLNVYGPASHNGFLSLILMPIFLLLFMARIFETKKHYPVEHWLLMAISVILAINLIFGVFNLVGALKMATALAAMMMLVSLSVSLSMLFRKHPLAPYFLLAHGLFIGFSVVSVLFFNGKVAFNYITSHAVSIGILLEALILALIISYRIRILQKIKDEQSALEQLASTDPLTKLFNRRAFTDTTSQLMAQAKYTERPICIALIDIDLFKKVNDSYGHSVGDKVIVRLAEELQTQCRLEDLPARFGGEEFIIFIPKTSLPDAKAFVERIRRNIEETLVITDSNEEVAFTISIGLALVDKQYPNLEHTIDLADQALYLAKEQGRNQTCTFLELPSESKKQANTLE